MNSLKLATWTTFKVIVNSPYRKFGILLYLKLLKDGKNISVLNTGINHKMVFFFTEIYRALFSLFSIIFTGWSKRADSDGHKARYSVQLHRLAWRNRNFDKSAALLQWTTTGFHSSSDSARTWQRSGCAEIYSRWSVQERNNTGIGRVSNVCYVYFLYFNMELLLLSSFKA